MTAPAQCSDDFDVLAPGQAMAVNWTERQYFSDRRALTRSALGLLPYKPLQFGAWVRGEDVEREATDDMRFGTLLHAAILERDRFASAWLAKPTKPAHARAGAAAGTPERLAFELWKRAEAAYEITARRNPDAIPLTHDDLTRINGICEAVRRHDVASVLLGSSGLSEQTIVWREPMTELLVKVRVDWLTRISAVDAFGTELAPGLYDVDLKSTAMDSPGLLAQSVRKFGYLPQAALYSDVTEALFGEPVSWMWVAVTGEPDSDGKHGVSVYALTPEQRERGREIYKSQLFDALDRLTRNDWTPAHRHGVHTLPL
jgi:hypothetical protein